MDDMDQVYVDGLNSLKNFMLNTSDQRFFVALMALFDALEKKNVPEAAMTVEAEDETMGLTISLQLSVKRS